MSPKESLHGKALNYMKNQWPKLTRYLEDGRLEISNNRTERSIKPFVIGRKNWMFSDSVAGAESAATIYSIIETCKHHKIDPYAYLKVVLQKMPTAETLEDLDKLLPFNLDKQLLHYKKEI